MSCFGTFRLEFEMTIAIFEISALECFSMRSFTQKNTYRYIWVGILKKIIVIFKINTLKFVTPKFVTKIKILEIKNASL